jgi:hypothetical protein
MKKTVLLFGFFALFSCSITERLVVLPDDQVKISHEINLSELLVMAKSMGLNLFLMQKEIAFLFYLLKTKIS